MFCVTMYITCQHFDILYTYLQTLLQAFLDKLAGYVKHHRPTITEIFTAKQRSGKWPETTSCFAYHGSLQNSTKIEKTCFLHH